MSYHSPPHDFESNGGAISAGVARAFEADDAARMRDLDRLIRAGFGSTNPRRIPPEVLHPPQEKPMQKCSQCGKQVRRDHHGVTQDRCQDCRKGRTKAALVSSPSAVEATPARTPAPAPAKKYSTPELCGLTVQDLLELRARVRAELADRLAKVEAERTALLAAVSPDREPDAP